MEQVEINYELIGQKLGEDIFSKQGTLLLKAGTKLTEYHISLLKNHTLGEKVQIFTDIPQSKFKSEPITLKPYEELLKLVEEEFNELIHTNRSTNFQSLIKKVSQVLLTSMQDTNITTVIEKRESNNYIIQHSLNVSILSAMIGKLLGYSKEECILIGKMGLFHDIGMLKLNESLLSKIELTTEDKEQIKTHTVMGYDLLKTIPYIHPLIPQASLLHHERINGGGYPMKFVESKIPFFVQIVSVADTFNAICSDRPHTPGAPFYYAVQEVVKEAEANQLNPAIVVPFVRYLMRQQLRESVMLSNNQEAEIVFIHDHEPHLPLVKIGENYVDLRKEPHIRLKTPV
ncbi:hypothetical protein Q73_06985 [Bacillus coahuilensis m2-6]|uniref:HD-GYP domain-containing protein n=1 Tax=Bacillus coahuilensis TaxID=408580 RepID=UPI0007504C11|nr:HD domain-containing phosphohydrolase [Bacillus coahuilensis]KUP08253.1 hypothetical protein Q73_06985 [Bacillus coahuilensis m2-6]